MEQVRQVSLMNENGEVINCMLRSSFFNDLSGLGFDIDTKFLNYGDGFFSPMKRAYKQGSVEGQMSFLNRATAYEDYRKLMDWISMSETLRRDRAIRLCYAPYNDDRYMKDVILASISKGEIDTGGYLTCSISFVGLTPWYREDTLEITSRTISGVAGENVTLKIDADLGGKFELKLAGSYTDPVIELFNGINVEIGIIDLTGLSVTTGQSIIISTLPGSIGIWKEDIYGTRTNEIDSIVFHDGYEVFFDLPAREDITITIRTGSSSETFTGTLNVYSYWRTR